MNTISKAGHTSVFISISKNIKQEKTWTTFLSEELHMVPLKNAFLT